MGFGEQWKLRSRINLLWTETSLGSFLERMAPLLTDRSILIEFLSTKNDLDDQKFRSSEKDVRQSLFSRKCYFRSKRHVHSRFRVTVNGFIAT
jgi:hypothetical protein